MDKRGNAFFGGHHADPKYLRQLAREYRANPTPAERRRWSRIRSQRLAGLRFRRQHILRRYIVDFFALLRDHPFRGLVVELDGRSHNFTREYDAIRIAWMEAQSFKVLRFPNEAVFDNIECVLDTIEHSINPR